MRRQRRAYRNELKFISFRLVSFKFILLKFIHSIAAPLLRSPAAAMNHFLQVIHGLNELNFRMNLKQTKHCRALTRKQTKKLNSFHEFNSFVSFRCRFRQCLERNELIEMEFARSSGIHSTHFISFSVNVMNGSKWLCNNHLREERNEMLL